MLSLRSLDAPPPGPTADAAGKAMSSSARGHRPWVLLGHRARRPGPDRFVLWSLCLYLLGFPLLLVSLAFITTVAADIGLVFGSDDRPDVQAVLNGGFVLLALLPFAAAAVLGAVGWVRGRRPVPLIVAVVSVLTIAVLIGVPTR